MNKVKLFFLSFPVIILMSLASSCSEVDFTMPQGPQGDQGLSAYEVWKEAVVNDSITDWNKSEVALTDFFKYLKGEKGADAQDGESAFEVWQDYIATGDVDDPHDSTKKWPATSNTVQDFWVFVSGATGESGITPHIGANLDWYIGDTDTGVLAKGIDAKFESPFITISPINGHWLINGQDTGVSAYSFVSSDYAVKGVTSYTLWVKDVQNGTLEDPYNEGNFWDKTKTSTSDFNEYLNGPSN